MSILFAPERRFAVSAVLCLLAGCMPGLTPIRVLPPLGDQGAVYFYLEPVSESSTDLAFSVRGMAAERDDGTRVPLEVLRKEINEGSMTDPLLWAWGRVPPGGYVGVALDVARATIAGDGGTGDLLLPEAPTTIELPFQVAGGQMTLAYLELKVAESVASGFSFAPRFTGRLPNPALPAVAGFCSSPTSDTVTVFDKHTRRTVAVWPTGREPWGLSVDAEAGRLYVAASGADVIEARDLVSGAEVGRVPLRTGDEPRELALTHAGRLLLVVNRGSSSVAFVDPQALVEVGRLQVGERPSTIVVDKSGARAYVVNTFGNSLSVIDLANQAVVLTVPTDPRPIRAQLSRDGTRLYVAHQTSPNVLVLSVPGMGLSESLYAGLGMSAIAVDRRADRLYVAMDPEHRVAEYLPGSQLQSGGFDAGASVAYFLVDDAEDNLFLVQTALRTVRVLSLTSRRLLGRFETAHEPVLCVVAGERS
ncbi:MAG: hypothetical protein HY903_09895 [Deltaproteobacteria bacterium]|nr:hypothetical protein [Deltaproteobacteria bacterium]